MRLIWALFLVTGCCCLSGCEADTGTRIPLDVPGTYKVGENIVTVEQSTKDSRLVLVEDRSEDGWQWKLLRDNKTEKEWLIIHDGRTMIVMPMESTHPASMNY